MIIHRFFKRIYIFDKNNRLRSDHKYYVKINIVQIITLRVISKDRFIINPRLFSVQRKPRQKQPLYHFHNEEVLVGFGCKTTHLYSVETKLNAQNFT